MTETEREELFDLQILRALDLNAGKTYGLGASSLQVLVAPYGFGAAKIEEINKRLHYLADADVRFVERVNKGEFHTANQTWRITARGINKLREHGY